MASGITGDSENGNDLFFTFFWRSPLLWAKIFGNLLIQNKMMLISKRSLYLSGRNLQCHPRLTAVVGPYFMAVFPRFWQKICINLKHFKKTRGTRAKCPRRTVWETLPLFNFFLFCFICHIYPPFTRKRIVSLYFGREVRTCLGGIALNDKNIQVKQKTTYSTQSLGSVTMFCLEAVLLTET